MYYFLNMETRDQITTIPPRMKSTMALLEGIPDKTLNPMRDANMRMHIPAMRQIIFTTCLISIIDLPF